MNDGTQRRNDEQVWKRRGLFAAGAALVAAVVAKVTEQPILAGVDGDVVLGASNTTTALTIVRNTAASGVALSGHATPNSVSPGSSTGVFGYNSNVGGSGVWGFASDQNGFGVYGSGYTAVNG